MTTAAALPAIEAFVDEPAVEPGANESAAPSEPERQPPTSAARKTLDEDFAPQPLPPRDPEMAARFDAWWNGMPSEERELLKAMAHADKLDKRHDR